MKILKFLLLTLLSLPLVLLFSNQISASDADFVIDTKTGVSYTTGDEFVTVKTEYIRNVKNSNYYFPASGEKTFHIPDVIGASQEDIEKEREFKKDTLTVTDNRGNSVNYSIEKEDIGKGLYVTVPNYKETTPTSPYHIIMQYKTHDYVVRVGDFVNIFGSSLPQDTLFERRDQENNTLTIFNYYYSIVVDEDIAPLTRAFPDFTKNERNGKTEYTFSQTNRINNSPNLEFGTSVLYRFELEYITPQTDHLIPERYSSKFQALSTNIYEISLPREFSETNQKVYFENISPLPSDIYRDTEGNILAMFEVPANQSSKISISGYISVSQDDISEEEPSYLDIRYNNYIRDIQNTEYVSRYLRETKYWEINDPLIKQEAERLLEGQEMLIDIIKANYQFVTERLEYDTEKATSENERIGAKAALLGGPAVCMEYADLMIALLRAQGIPSRAAIGYANLREIAPADQVRHQWVQVWVPEYGWLSVDPTFESANMKIGQMVDRVLWEVFNDDSLSNIRIYSANNIVDLTTEGFSIKIEGVSSDNVDLEGLKSYSDLTSGEEIREQSTPSFLSLLNTILKTTTIGKALLITVPILIVLAVLVIIIGTTTSLIKRQKAKKKSSLKID